jgi:hypothetical protein
MSLVPPGAGEFDKPSVLEGLVAEWKYSVKDGLRLRSVTLTAATVLAISSQVRDTCSIRHAARQDVESISPGVHKFTMVH